MKRILLAILAGVALGSVVYHTYPNDSLPQAPLERITFPLSECYKVAATAAFTAQQITNGVSVADVKQAIRSMGDSPIVESVMLDLVITIQKLYGDHVPMTIAQSDQVGNDVQLACLNSDENGNGHATYYRRATTHL